MYDIVIVDHSLFSLCLILKLKHEALI